MPELEVVFLREDELEALRLCDLEGLDQMSAGERMGVSRGTVQRLLKSGRGTLVRALVDNSALVIGSARGLSGPVREQGVGRAEVLEDEVERAGAPEDEDGRA
jgi:predicted DNA-binding protein (UPF0251 family)